MAPYWIIVNDDVAFGHGLLKEMVDAYAENVNVGMIHPNKGDFNLGSWDLFLISDIIIQEFGLFDENLYPAYCEDADYIMRFAHAPISKVIGLNSTYYHGPGTKEEYYTHGSQTKKADPLLNDKLEKINQTNFEYMNKKWGEGWRTCSPNVYPFNKPDIPKSYTTYDLDFLRKKYLGFGDVNSGVLKNMTA